MKIFCKKYGDWIFVAFVIVIVIFRFYFQPLHVVLIDSVNSKPLTQQSVIIEYSKGNCGAVPGCWHDAETDVTDQAGSIHPDPLFISFLTIVNYQLQLKLQNNHYSFTATGGNIYPMKKILGNFSVNVKKVN